MPATNKNGHMKQLKTVFIIATLDDNLAVAQSNWKTQNNQGLSKLFIHKPMTCITHQLQHKCDIQKIQEAWIKDGLQCRSTKSQWIMGSFHYHTPIKMPI